MSRARLPCAACGFAAKNSTGLAIHRARQHGAANRRHLRPRPRPGRKPAAPKNGQAARSTKRRADLVRSLAAALVELVLRQLAAELQTATWEVGATPLFPSHTRTGTATAKPGAGRVTPAPGGGPRPATLHPSPSTFHDLTDDQLRDRLGVAKAAKNLGLAAKITNVLKMRDRSATVIANTHQEET